MNAYDFDKTIYDGNSTADFYRFCVRRNPKAIRRLTSMIPVGIRYIAGITNKTASKQCFFGFLRDIENVDAELDQFWDVHIHRIKRWYAQIQRPDDVLISASPEFLLAPACKRLGIRYLLASPVDAQTGLYAGLNCDGEEKVRRFCERFPGAQLERFYSDSDDDIPMARFAGQSFKVKGDDIHPWEFR